MIAGLITKYLSTDCHPYRVERLVCSDDPKSNTVRYLVLPVGSLMAVRSKMR